MTVFVFNHAWMCQCTDWNEMAFTGKTLSTDVASLDNLELSSESTQMLRVFHQDNNREGENISKAS